MIVEQSALLVADVGMLVTRVFLIDIVANEYRLLARAEVLSTLEQPQRDCTLAILAGARQIEELTGRQLVVNDQIVTPHKSDGSGVDAVMVATSAAGVLPIVTATVSQASSGASARRGIRSTYTTLLEEITLDDQAQDHGVAETSWIERQVDRLRDLQPKAIVIAGGVEEGADTALVRLVRLLALTVLAPRRERGLIPVIFAGNSAARQQVIDAMADVAPVTAVDNIRPRLEQEYLAPLQTSIASIYNDKFLPTLPGISKLRSWTMYQPQSIADGYPVLARFIAAYYQCQVLLADIGAGSTSCYLADSTSVSPTVLGDVGITHGAVQLVEQAGPASVARWLPFEMTPQEVTDRVFTQLLRLPMLPTSAQDLLFQQALAREALRLAYTALRDEHERPQYTLVLATGGVLTHTQHPAQAALMIIDALEPGRWGQVVIDIFLDTMGLLPACAVLAGPNTDAAFCLLDQDVIRGGPLASLVTVVGNPPAGQPAVQVELTVPGRQPQTISVMPGEIRRLPLPRGRKGTLILRPAPGVRIGQNEPGAEVQTDQAAIRGSTLGVIIDARGRPIKLADDPEQRRKQQWSWFAALSGAQPNNPFATTPTPEQPAAAPVPQPAVAEEAPPMPPWLAPDAQAEVPFGVQDLGEQSQQPDLFEDLSQLRGSIEEPKKKRRFFGK